jgi:hypothetical protein
MMIIASADITGITAGEITGGPTGINDGITLTGRPYGGIRHDQK